MTVRNLARNLVRICLGIAVLGYAVAYFVPSLSTSPAPPPQVRRKLPAEQREYFASALRHEGWNCEDAKDVWRRPDTDRGKAVKVLCGPPGGAGVQSDRIFNIVIQPNDRLIVTKGTLSD